MFSKKDKQKRNHSGKSLSQYGLFDMPTNFDEGLDNADDDEHDSDLEAELAALSGSGGVPKQRKKPARKILPEKELNSMIADSMKDIDDDDVSVDENDPDLLDELNELTGDNAEGDSPTPQSDSINVGSSDTEKILSERLTNYKISEKAAKEAGEVSKSRRYGRAIKTLNDLLKQAHSGKNIDLNDETIPPEIHISTEKTPSQPVPSRPAPAIPDRAPVSVPTESVEEAPVLPDAVQENVQRQKQEVNEELLDMLRERQKEYKIAALKAKKAGDAKTAIEFVKIAKQFDAVIEAVQNGQEVDLSQMPGPPNESASRLEPKIEQSETQKNTVPEIALPEAAADLPEPQLITATTVLEALEQRLAFYVDLESQAKEQENSSKARRYGRLVKQFQQALKAHKAGKPVDLEELPTPPGFGPFPTPGGASAAVKPEATTPAGPPKTNTPDTEENRPKPTPVSKPSGNSTHADKQVLILVAKQKQFKQSALNAKKQGEMEQAKEFLKQAKGFDKLIEAARSGLPVDWSSIPVSPEAKSQLDNEYDIVMADDCGEETSVDSDLLARLENQLQKQLKMCLTTRDHNKALGDVASMNKFERLALNVTKDLDVVRVARRTSRVVPKFHYEQKDFAIVKSFTEIMDNHMELTVHRGINYQSDNPKDIDTYVKLEFPFPQDIPFTDTTSTIKNTNNPEYQKTFVIPIQRNSRQCQRVFKRHGIKFEIYSKGGFFRSDSLIGTVNVKLQPLETQCEIHDSFDLLDGRKKVGGKLEVQMKLRTPIVTQQVEHIQEKWLIIDQ
ncbi:hypothetical protein JTB14_022624 [Gonioctena quinquepunctata]|nr:hypothetical protein JTB14_022624 [Gonioctena quinquepunctata]